MSTDIQIYVADLAAYNNSILHGAWIDATQGVVEIQDEISAMLTASPIEDAEEYAIHDYEGFEGYKVSEYEGIAEVQSVACFIDEHGKLGAELLDYYDLDAGKKNLEDHYYGCFNSVADYTQQLTEETSQVPEHLQLYIDYDKMGRDMELSGEIFTIETTQDEIHVFWNS